MKLNLTKPIAFFDIESTGVDVAQDRIIEISILKVFPDGKTETKTQRVNPVIPIPYEASMVHGIFDKDVENEPTFKQVAKNLANYIDNCDLAGYNCIKFDIPILVEEFLRAEVDFEMKGRRVVDVQNIFHQMEQRTLKAAYKFYCDKELINAHSAEADISATYEVMLAQIERYKGVVISDKTGNPIEPVQNDITALHNFTNIRDYVDYAGRIIFDDKGREVFNFGKHKGKAVTDVFRDEPSYYSWMMQGDFPLYTKKIISEIRLRGAFKK